MITEFQMQTYLIIRDFRQKRNKKEDIDLRICGGANIVQQLMKQNLIDVYYISIIPTILGNGIRLFESINHCINLHLLKTQNNNGVIELIYEKK